MWRRGDYIYTRPLLLELSLPTSRGRTFHPGAPRIRTSDGFMSVTIPPDFPSDSNLSSLMSLFRITATNSIRHENSNIVPWTILKPYANLKPVHTRPTTPTTL